MQRTHTSSAARNHPARMPMSFVAGLGILLMAGTGFPSAGLAQSQPSPGTDSRGTAMPREGMPLAIRKAAFPKRRWATVSRARRTCRRASCVTKAAAQTVAGSTRTGR